VQKHLSKGTLSLDGLNTLVLDEADRMLDMGFVDSIAEIIGQTPARRQTLLFSATYPAGIEDMAGRFLRDPARIEGATQHDDQQIEQRFYEVTPETRLEAVTRLLYSLRPTSCVAFCFTKQQCQEVADHLAAKGVSAKALNGDLDQRDRDQVLGMFANRSLSVLVATDVAARGLDIASLDLVINVELGRDPETHIHRIGRTGRAGEKGLAVSLVAPKEMRRALAIEDQQKGAIQWQSLDEVRPHVDRSPLQAPMATLCIAAGRKQKLRPGDILGALTGDAGIPGAQVGKITLFDNQAYVAVERAIADKALQRLSQGKIKGRSLRVRAL
jgi:ATP-independent RNA helicase DbpA